MKAVPTSIGTVHFIGIGGIGMSGIAEVMHNLGYSVQGTDIAESYVVEGLRKKGIKVMIGHAAENLGDAAVVVTSTAREPRGRSSAGAAHSHRPSCRDAGRADASEINRCGGRHSWQDDDNVDDCGDA